MVYLCGKRFGLKIASAIRKEGPGMGWVWVEKQAVEGKDPKWRPE